MYEKVFTNGLVFLGERLVKADIAINGEKIAAIGTELDGKTRIDVAGKWVLPGALDVHTHFSLPFAGAVSADDFFTGTRAGAIGGVTSIIDFLAQDGDEGILESFLRRLGKAQGEAAVDFSFHACIGRFSPAVEAQMPELPGKGINSLKVFTAYGKTGLMQSDFNLLRIMKSCRENGIMLSVHAENGLLIDDNLESRCGNLGIEALPATRPVLSEVEAIRRVGWYARETGCKTYIVHTSSGDGAEAIAGLRRDGAPIIGETCPQYLYLDDTKLAGPEGHYYSCCPPIRPLAQQANLWHQLGEGNLAVIATDHCPFNRADKDSWQGNIEKLPMGLPGIEILPALALNRFNCLDTITAIKSISENPAKIFGLFPEKGSLQPGTDADIMIFDPDCEWQISQEKLNMANDYSPYEGLRIKGKNLLTMLRGEIIFAAAQGGWKGKKGAGRFLARKKADSSFFGN